MPVKQVESSFPQELWSIFYKKKTKGMLVAKAKDFTKCHHKELLSSKALILLQLTAVYTATKGQCTSHRRVLNVPEVLWSHHDQEHGHPGIEKGVRAPGYMFTSLSKASASVWASDFSQPPATLIFLHSQNVLSAYFFTSSVWCLSSLSSRFLPYF